MEAVATTSANGNTGWGYVLTAPAGRAVTVTWFKIDAFSSSASVIGDAEPTSHGPGEAMRFFVNGLEADDIVTLEVFAFTGIAGDCTGAMTSRRSASQTVSIAADGPTATTGIASGISATGATLAAEANVPAGATILRRGVVLSESSDPVVGGTDVIVVEDDLAIGGVFSADVEALGPETTYFFRAFVESAAGFSYGGSASFVTSSMPTPTPVNPEAAPVAVAVEQAAGIAGIASLLVRDAVPVPVTTTVSSVVGPRRGLVVEDEERTLRVTISTSVGVSRDAGVIVPVGGEIVCEICAELAAGSVVEAWIYSTPRLTAAVQVGALGEDGCPLLRIPTSAPLDGEGEIEPGAHTLQLRMYTSTGFEVLAVPITVGQPLPSSVPAGAGPSRPGGALDPRLFIVGLAGVAVLASWRRGRVDKNPGEHAVPGAA